MSVLVRTNWHLSYEHLKHSCSDGVSNWWPCSQLLQGCKTREEASLKASEAWARLDKSKYKNPALVRHDVTIDTDWKPSS